jgi:glycosyltransferase involved in cell wall biosynthesis
MTNSTTTRLARPLPDPTGKCSITDPGGRPRPAFLVFADDWGRHPSSCQHLMGRLLDRHQVYWVNTIGTRSPRLNWSTVKRGGEKFRQWLRPSRAGAAPTTASGPAPQPTVLNPRMWPWFGSAFSRRLNRSLLSRQLLPLLRSLPVPPVAVTTLPITADLVGELPVERWVYYCVDDFGQWPGLDQAALRRLDDLLIRRADVLIAVSETLQQRIAALGRDSTLLTHGVDLSFWQGGADGCLPAEVEALERPFVVFWGVVDRRMDLTFLQSLSASLRRGTILLVGPRDDPDPAVLAVPRVAYHPPLPFPLLPRLAREAGALVMPYADLPVTRAIQPLKLKEYLATGRPVVVRSLPATRPWGDCLDLAEDAGSFARLVVRRLEGGILPRQAGARSRLRDEGWQAKAEQFERLALAFPSPRTTESAQ